VAGRLGAHEPTLTLLLNALVAMRLLNKEGETFGNSAAAATHLVKHSPQYIGHLLLLHDAEWENWGKLEQTVRTGQRAVDRHVFETDPELGTNVLAVLHRIGQQSGPRSHAGFGRRRRNQCDRVLPDLPGTDGHGL
jgi:hypothetical protein